MGITDRPHAKRGMHTSLVHLLPNTERGGDMGIVPIWQSDERIDSLRDTTIFSILDANTTLAGRNHRAGLRENSTDLPPWLIPLYKNSIRIQKLPVMFHRAKAALLTIF